MKNSKIIGALLAGVMAISSFAAVPGLSDTFIITTDAASALAAPKNIKAEDTTDTTIKLTWSAVSGADAYRVFMLNEKTGKYEKYKNVQSISCKVTGLKRASSYKFKVAALIAFGSGYEVQTKSSAKTIKTMTCAAPGYVGTIGYASEPWLDLEWGKVTDADAYRIYKLDTSSGEFKVYKSAVDPETLSKTYSTEKRMFIYRLTVKDLPSGKNTFKVAALVKNKDGSYTPQTKSSAFSARIGKFLPKLATPTNVKTRVSGNTLTITWDPVPGAAYYTLTGRSVLTSGGSSRTTVPGGDHITTTSYTASGQKGQTYYFELTAIPADTKKYRNSDGKDISATIK